MACFPASATHSRANGQRSDGAIADIVLHLTRENDALSEEAPQLGATIQIYSELTACLSGRQQQAERGIHGTL
jgi:hypothetical protein